MNGTTNQDRTYYFEVVPSNFLELALFMEADRMGGLLDAMTRATTCPTEYDVVIVGGGVVGCAIARRLSFTTARVALVERDGGLGIAAAALGGKRLPQRFHQRAGAEHDVDAVVADRPGKLAVIDGAIGRAELSADKQVQRGALFTGLVLTDSSRVPIARWRPRPKS